MSSKATLRHWRIVNQKIRHVMNHDVLPKNLQRVLRLSKHFSSRNLKDRFVIGSRGGKKYDALDARSAATVLSLC